MIKPSWLDPLGSERILSEGENPVRFTFLVDSREYISDLPTIVR